MTPIGISNLGVGVHKSRAKGKPSPVIPSTITLSNTAVPSDTYVGATIGFLSSDIPDATFSLVDDGGGYVSVAGTRMRLEQPPAERTIVVRATGAAGHKDEVITLTAPQATMPAGLFARFDTKDASKLTVASGKLAKWVDKVNGFEIEQTTSAIQPIYDTVNTMNGFPTIASSPSAAVQMKTSANPVNDPLNAMLNDADAKFTIIAVIEMTTAAPSNARELISWGNSNTALTGGARNYLIWRQGTGVSTYSIMRGDTVVPIITTASAVLFPTSPVPEAGKHIISVRSNGKTGVQGFDKYDGLSGDINNDTSVQANVFSLFNRAISPSASTAWEGRLAAILIWNRDLSQTENNTAQDILAAEFGLTMPAPPPLIDLSQYELDYEKQWGVGTPYNEDPATDLVNPDNWILGYLRGRGPLGTNGALDAEVGWYADVRHPRFAPYKDRLIKVEDYILKLRAIPRPPELSDLSLLNGNGQECTYLNTGLISFGHFAAQYGYFETRVKYSFAASGAFGADWGLPEEDFWLPTEFDNHECMGAGTDNDRQANLHTAPYYPLFSSKDMKQPIKATIPSRSADFQLYGFLVDPDTGITVIHNRRPVGTFAPHNGAISLAVANGGSGVVADNGTADGTISIKALSTDPKMQDATGSLTVSGGVVTAATVSFPGVKMAPVPTWTRSSGSTIGGGVVLTTTVANDPMLPTVYNTLMYWLLAMQVGTNNAGNPDGVSEFEMQVDYFRHYRKKIAAPTIAAGTDSDAQAVFDRASSLGAAFSTQKRTKLNDFIKQAKAWKLRFDVLPMGDGTGPDWDVTKLSIWDRLEHMWLMDYAEAAPQSPIDFRAPLAANDLVPSGSPAFTVGGGYDLGPSKSLVGPTIGVSNLIRTMDNHIGIDLASITHTATSAVSIISAGSNFYFGSSTTASSIRLMSAVGISTSRANQPIGPGLHIATRGHRAGVKHFKDGQRFRSGYFSSNNIATSGLGSLVIGGGSSCPVMRVKKAFVGGRFMPAEAEKLSELFAELYA